jgi:hypothetical protein
VTRFFWNGQDFVVGSLQIRADENQNHCFSTQENIHENAVKCLKEAGHELTHMTKSLQGN